MTVDVDTFNRFSRDPRNGQAPRTRTRRITRLVRNIITRRAGQRGFREDWTSRPPKEPEPRDAVGRGKSGASLAVATSAARAFSTRTEHQALRRAG